MQQQIDRCGDCHSCCKSFGWIDNNQIRLIELDIQYEWDRCNKLCDNNRCTIYDNRPKTCSDFECLYVESDLPEEYLPEKVGFVTDLRRDEHGLFLNIVPNESKKYNIDARKFGEENIENITSQDLSGVKENCTSIARENKRWKKKYLVKVTLVWT